MLDNLSGLLATLIALSVAAERLVAIIKGFSVYLSTELPNAKAEHRRQAVLQVIAIGAGLLTAALAYRGDALPARLTSAWTWPLLGLLASGGSSFWTSVLGYVNGIKDVKKSEKDIKKSQAIGAKVKAAAAIAAIANGAARPVLAEHEVIALRATGKTRVAQANAAGEAGALSSEAAQQATAALERIIREASAQL